MEAKELKMTVLTMLLLPSVTTGADRKLGMGTESLSAAEELLSAGCTVVVAGVRSTMVSEDIVWSCAQCTVKPCSILSEKEQADSKVLPALVGMPIVTPCTPS